MSPLAFSLYTHPLLLPVSSRATLQTLGAVLATFGAALRFLVAAAGAFALLAVVDLLEPLPGAGAGCCKVATRVLRRGGMVSVLSTATDLGTLTLALPFLINGASSPATASSTSTSSSVLEALVEAVAEVTVLEEGLDSAVSSSAGSAVSVSLVISSTMLLAGAARDSLAICVL